MRNLCTVEQNLFGLFTVVSKHPKYKTRVAGSGTTEKEATAARDRHNVDMLIEEVTEFVLKYGSKLPYYHKEKKLADAREAKSMLYRFITGANTLRQKKEATAPAVYDLLHDCVLPVIGDFESPVNLHYTNSHGLLLHLVNEFCQMYAPPIVENPIYQDTPASREFFNHKTAQ